MPDFRILNYAIQGTSSSSTWRARIHPFLSVLTSVSIFSFACHESFIVELPLLSSNKLKVIDTGLADFSDSSAILDLLITHCNRYTVFSGPALFLSQILHYSTFIDDIFETIASLTLLNIVLRLDAANCAGIYGIIPAALTANFLTSPLFLSQSQLGKTFCIIIWFDSRIQAHRQKTLAVATPNHDLSSPWRMGLIQFLVIEPFNPRLGPSAPLTVITDATGITESAHPVSALTVSINLPIRLVIYQINSDVLYHARLRSGSSFSKTLFDSLTRNVTVSAFSDIQVPIFSALAANIAMRDAIIVEFPALSVWDDFDPHTVYLPSRNTAMGIVQAFRAVSEVGRFGIVMLKGMPDTPILYKEYQTPGDQIIGTASYVFKVFVNEMKAFNNLRHHVFVWLRNLRHTDLTKPVPSHSSRRRMHDGHLAFSARIQQLLDNVGEPSASELNDGPLKTGSLIEAFLEYSSVLLKSITQFPHPIPVASDVHEGVVLLEDISPFDRRQISKMYLKRHLPVSSAFTNVSSGFPLKDNASSTVASQSLETSIPFAHTPVAHISNTDFPTFPDFSQHSCQDNAYVATFKTLIGQLANSILGHCVDGIPLCPASIYLEQVFVGLQLSHQRLRPTNDRYAVLRAVEFIRPLVYKARDPRIVIVEFSPQDDSKGTFFVASEVDGTIETSIHVRGEYRIDLIPTTSTKFRRILPIINRRISSVFKVKNGKTPQRFSTRTIYEVIFSRVVEYSKEYQTIQSLTVDPAGVEGYASVKLPALHERRGRFTVHPAFIDTLLHVAGFVMNLQGGINDAYICSRVDSVKVIASQIEDDANYGVYCSQYWLADQGIMLAEAYAVKLADPPILVARLKGIHFRKLRLNSLKASLVHALGDPTGHRRMRPVDPTAQSLPALQSSFTAEVPSPTVSRPARDVSGARTCLVEEGSGKPMSPMTDQNVDIRHLLATVLNVCIEDIAEDDNLEKLGLCTSPPLEILTALKSKLGIEAPEQFFTDHPTLKTVLSYLASSCFIKRSQSQAQVASPQGTVKCQIANDEPKPKVLVSSTTVARLTKALKLGEIPLPLQSSTVSSLPLFLIHDGSGLISYYNGIPSLGRQVWGINNPRFISSEPWRGIVEMASYYACHIARVVTGPIIIGGWSFGGVVAYEASLQLAKKGVQIRGVLLIDSPNPINHVPLSEDLIDCIVNLDARSANTDLGHLVKAQFSLNADMLSHYDPRETGGTCPPLVLLRSSEGFDPPSISNVPRWLADRSDPKTATLGWENLACGPIKILDIPGHHFTPFKSANIKRVCERIKEACTLFEAE